MALGGFRLFPKKYGWFPYIWPIYLLLPLINLRGEHGVKLLLGIGLVFLFAVTYRQLYVSHGIAFHSWLALQMILTIVLCAFYNPYNFFMGFFSSYFIGWYLERRPFITALAGFAVAQLLSIALSLHYLQGNDLLFLLPFLVIMLITPNGSRSMNQRMQLEKDLGIAQERIKELVKREERLRIARDLHDTLGHTLSLITLKSQLVEKLITKDPERAKGEAREIQRTSRAALRQVRELVSDMRAVTITEAVAEADEILGAADIALQVQGSTQLPEVPDLSKNIISLCIKEAVTNIVKHSKAGRCTITIQTTPAEVRLTIEDDGIGLSGYPKAGSRLEDEQAQSGQADPSPGNGLKGMAERLSLIDGTLSVTQGSDSAHREGIAATVADPGTHSIRYGTRLVITIPLIIKETNKEGESV